MMARRRDPHAGMTLAQLSRLLETELPAPDPMLDRDGWRWVMQRRYDRAAEFGFDVVDALRCSLHARRRRAQQVGRDG